MVRKSVKGFQSLIDTAAQVLVEHDLCYNGSMKNRIGFACKWIDTVDQLDSIPPDAPARALNTAGTTITWLARQRREVAEARLLEIMRWNIAAVGRLVERVSSLEPHLRMVRLTSDLLPAYTHPDWTYWWSLPEIRAELERALAPIGELARRTGTRLSFHPGQFCVLASHHEEIVERSILEVEYHADVARWMGFGQRFQDMKINVHIAGKRGPAGIIDILPRLSPEARNTLAIENDEMSWGVDASLELADHLALVLDIHHHWIRTGEYIEPTDPRAARIAESWRGVVPVIHYSVSREDELPGHSPVHAPDHAALLAQGYKKGKLRAHSNFYWNREVNEWAARWSHNADIMCEAKGKNLASFEFAKVVDSLR